MKIAVCIKQVPDTASILKLKNESLQLDRDAAENVMNELDEYAVEAALQLAEQNEGSTVTVVSMGPEKTGETIRKALSMGVDDGLHLTDPLLSGADAFVTSYALAHLLKERHFDLIMFGAGSTDSGMSVIPSMVAEQLGLPQLTSVRTITLDGTYVSAERVTDSYTGTVTASMPAVASVVEKANEPRYPSFKGIMAAKKKPVEVLSAHDAGLFPELNSLCMVVDAAPLPPKPAGTVITDDGTAATKIADYLSEQKFI